MSHIFLRGFASRDKKTGFDVHLVKEKEEKKKRSYTEKVKYLL